jgi:hypothetical protein
MRLSSREKYFAARRGTVTHADLEQQRKADQAAQTRQETATKNQAKEAAKGSPLFGADEL